MKKKCIALLMSLLMLSATGCYDIASVTESELNISAPQIPQLPTLSDESKKEIGEIIEGIIEDVYNGSGEEYSSFWADVAGTQSTSQEQASSQPQSSEQPSEPSTETDVSQDVTSPSGTESTTGLEVHFIDVGQGDATLIKCGGKSLLFDFGDNGKESVLIDYLKNNLSGSLTYAVLSHWDSDHAGGLEELIENTGYIDYRTTLYGNLDDTNTTVTYKYTNLAMDDLGYSFLPSSVGESISLGEATVTFIAPNNSLAYYEGSENNYSIALLVQYGETRIVLSGDCESAAERDIISNSIDISDITLYKVGHHGSYSASTDAFLDAMTPQYAIISCGSGNDYGHPHDVVLRRLENHNVTVYRTDLSGDIVFTSDGTNYSFLGL